MSEFKKLRLDVFPRIQEHENADVRYWRSFSVTRSDKHFGSVSSINFAAANISGVASDGLPPFLVTASTRLCLYSSQSDKVQRSFTRFNEDAFSGVFRGDAKLLAAGDRSGAVKVFDSASKSLLRELRPPSHTPSNTSSHTSSGAVQAVSWSPDGLSLLAGSDCPAVRLFDLSTGALTFASSRTSSNTSSTSAHTDYVRSVCFLASASFSPSFSPSQVFASASLDGRVIVWDSRMSSSSTSNTSSFSAAPCLALAHARPVHCMVCPAAGLLLTASHARLSLWDLRHAAQPLAHSEHAERAQEPPEPPAQAMTHSMTEAMGSERHGKQIAALALHPARPLVVSAGLDHRLQVTHWPTMRRVAGINTDKPVSALAFATAASYSRRSDKDNKDSKEDGEEDGEEDGGKGGWERAKLVVGFVDGTLEVRARERRGREREAERAEGEPMDELMGDLSRKRAMGRGRFFRPASSALPALGDLSRDGADGIDENGASTGENGEEWRVAKSRSARLQPHERELKRFSHARALDRALDSRNPLAVLSLLRELGRRGALTHALEARDDASLEPLLAFIARFISQTRYAPLLLDVAHVLLDMYAPVIGTSDAADELFLALRRQVRAELGAQRSLMRCVGLIDGIVNASLAHTDGVVEEQEEV